MKIEASHKIFNIHKWMSVEIFETLLKITGLFSDEYFINTLKTSNLLM